MRHPLMIFLGFLAQGTCIGAERRQIAHMPAMTSQGTVFAKIPQSAAFVTTDSLWMEQK
jgi:hypothetical protein